MALYKYYQKNGGTEPWIPTRSETDLTAVSPTFITVLHLDTLETLPDDKPTKELLTGIKYFGPMYFDLDDDEDVMESVSDGNNLIDKLFELGIEATDIEIYLSGKKGIHILVSSVCFMEKQVPVQFLPAIYKEIAFKLALPTIDFKVYTARTGRLLRTCYNVRENGNYRVPITVDELKALTAEGYNELCRTPRIVAAPTPTFRPAFALIYDAAKQKVSKNAGKKSKPIDAAQIKLHLPIVQQVMRGEVAHGVGFNKVAIQLAIYARDAGIAVDTLVGLCAGLINSHSGDGSRYNTPSKREFEIRRMVDYVESNTSYEYAIGPMKALLPRADGVAAEPQFDEEGHVIDAPNQVLELEAFSCGVSEVGHQYVASKGDAGDVAISNFIFTDIIKLVTVESEEIIGLKVTIKGAGRPRPPIIMTTSQFTGSSGLQNAISMHGGSFSGSDIHARGILQIMLHRVSDTRYVIESEGVNLITMPLAEDERLRTPFVVWADSMGVRAPDWVTESGIRFDFSGYPDPMGELKTDLTLAPPLNSYIAASEESKQFALSTLKALFSCQDHEPLGKMIGWMIATFWRQQFNNLHGKFPMLHVYGPAGLGKTETTVAMLKFFYYRQSPAVTAPSGTPFALLRLIGASGSIPIVLDEYKPAKMPPEVLEKYRTILREAYNMKESIRGGGNRSKDSFSALNKMELSGPVAYIAEAPETENALADRSVHVGIRQPTPGRKSRNFSNMMAVKRGLEVLSSVGHSLAAMVIADERMAGFAKSFDRLHDKAVITLMVQEEDEQALADGTMTAAEFKTKSMVSQRSVYNRSVALFGLMRLKSLLKQTFPEEFEATFAEDFDEMQAGVFKGLNELAMNMVPEYIKLMTTMGDMTQLAPDDKVKLVEGLEYNLSEIGGKAVLAVAVRAAYTKYRMHCRNAGIEYYYANEYSFVQAMRETPQFIKTGKGTARVSVETMIFDMEDLQRAGMSRWSGKPIKLP